MLLLNLKQILRGLWRYKSFTLINLLGLSIGLAAVLLIMMIAGYEKQFDQFHSSTGNIFRVVSMNDKGNKEGYEAAVPYPAAKLLRNELPGVKAAEIHFSNNANVRISTHTPFAETNIVFADSLFFDVFDFAGIGHFILKGDPAAALAEPNKAILTASAAKKYFGSEDPLGKIIKLESKIEVQVAAVVKDPPPTTHLPFNMLVSYASLTNDYIGGFDLNSWGLRSQGYCYVRIDKNNSVSRIEHSLHSIVQKNADSDKDRRQKFYLQPLSQIHFDPIFESSNPSYTISPRYLTMLLLLGVFIILIACINYINLSTSLAFSKSKEVGIRKTIGASRFQLFSLYISETFLVTTSALIIGLLIAWLCLPSVNRLLDKSVSFRQVADFRFIAGIIGGLLLVSFISGVYPALILSGFKPTESLKSQLAMPGKSSTLLRRALVVFQFTTSIGLIICTMIIAKQMHYFNSRSLGFNKDAVVEVSLPSPDSLKIESFRNLLQNLTGVQQVSFCVGAPISDNGISTNMSAPELPEKNDYNVKIIACDRNYLETYGIRLIAGRWFLQGEEKNIGSGIVVNEELVKTLGYKPEDAPGKKITIGINDYKPQIIGVVRDFNTSSFHQAISPVLLMPFKYFYYAAGIRVAPGNLKNTLANIETAYRQVYPDYVYQVSFVDETLAKSYAQDARNFNLFKAFSAISIFICCIGLWGLLAFFVVRKTKEIGIRKVLGASVTDIVGQLSKDFLILVIIALLVASPIAWYLMHQWLENFAYRINISWWVFVLAGIFAICIAMATISFQTVKAAIANPVKSLRTE